MIIKPSRREFLKYGVGAAVLIGLGSCNPEDFGNPLVDETIIRDVDAPPRSDSIWIQKIYEARGNENSLDYLFGPWDQKYTRFSGSKRNPVQIVVGFGKPFYAVGITALVERDVWVRGHSIIGPVYFAKNPLERKIMLNFNADDDRMEEGFVESSSGEVEIQIDTGYTPERMFAFEVDGDIKIDCMWVKD